MEFTFNRYYILLAVGALSTLTAFVSRYKRNKISPKYKLGIVLAYEKPDRKDKEARQILDTLEKEFKAFDNDRWYKEIGIPFSVVVADDTFKKRYLYPSIELPALLFFKEGALMKDETILLTSDVSLSERLQQKLTSSVSPLREIIRERENEYKEEKVLQEEREALMLDRMYYYTYDPYFNCGYYDPFYGGWGYSNIGFGMGWSAHRHCR